MADVAYCCCFLCAAAGIRHADEGKVGTVLRYPRRDFMGGSAGGSRPRWAVVCLLWFPSMPRSQHPDIVAGRCRLDSPCVGDFASRCICGLDGTRSRIGATPLRMVGSASD